MRNVIAAAVVVAAIGGMAGGRPSRGAGGVIDLRGGRIAGERVLDSRGALVGRLEARADRGAVATLAPDGWLTFRGQTHSETIAALAAGAGSGGGRVLEARFVLARPQGFYGHMVILSPRAVGRAAYRISYRFVSPCASANNWTGFFLTNTRSASFRQNPLDPPPMAGGRVRLSYGHEYLAHAAVRDSTDGVNVRLHLRDLTAGESASRLVFDFTDRSPERIGAGADEQVQVGAGGLIRPASTVRFGGLRILGAEALEAATAEAATPMLAGRDDGPADQPSGGRGTWLPNLFAHGMVVQRGRRIAVWGRGAEGDRITVSMAGQSAVAHVVGGRWRTALPAMAAGGPHTLTVSGSDRILTVRDVLVGEVWILGGQSNMGYYLSGTSEAPEECRRADFPAIRVFAGWHPAADAPAEEMDGGAWRAISPALEGRFSAVGYYFGRELHRRLGVPVGLIDTSTPATGIECWLSAGAARAQFPQLPAGLGDPSCYFNGKVAPVMGTAAAGVIWYQGDGSSAETGLAYRRYIAALIADWRAGFHRRDLPFLVVQIPAYEGCSPEMRESQSLAAAGAGRAGVAVTLDTGDATDIHPRNKRPVGERLALLARQLAYGERVEGMAPAFRTAMARGDRLRVRFAHAGRGLALRDGGGFELCGADGRFLPARAAVTGRDTVEVWREGLRAPRAVRYAWAPVPAWCVWSAEGLPAGPFRAAVRRR